MVTYKDVDFSVGNNNMYLVRNFDTDACTPAQYLETRELLDPIIIAMRTAQFDLLYGSEHERLDDLQRSMYHVVARAFQRATRSVTVRDPRNADLISYGVIVRNVYNWASCALHISDFGHLYEAVVGTGRWWCWTTVTDAGQNFLNMHSKSQRNNSTRTLPTHYGLAVYETDKGHVMIDVWAAFTTGARVFAPVGLIPHDWLQKNASLIEAHILAEALV